jgi:stearoyl-CoA desaturase (delta-9 desaturase)
VSIAPTSTARGRQVAGGRGGSLARVSLHDLDAPTPPADARPDGTITMSRAHRTVNLVVVFAPFALLALAVPLLWDRLVGPVDLALFLVFYVLSGFGVTVGFHRLLTHRAFATHRSLQYLWAFLGSLSLQGPVIAWVADHRKHHAHTDRPGDPHSPHVGHDGEDGLRGALRGLWHAHAGWLYHNDDRAEARRYARDLVEDPGMRLLSRNFPLIALATFLLPFAAGWALTGSLAGGLTGMLWGGLVRVFALHHVTWSINSVCHFFGRRRFATDDESTNVAWLALPSFGEAWHHNHHAFPRSAEHGLRAWERAMDPSAWLIGAMRRLGLAWDVVRITPERQRQKLA